MIGRLLRAMGRALDALLWSGLLAITAWTRPLERREARRAAERRTWKQRAFEAAVLFAVLGLIGILVAISGIVPIKASSGHWPITAWILQFGKERSVSTHTLGMNAPSLDDPALVMKGAGHFQTACAACHGTPEQPTPRVAASMTPSPPYLPRTVGKWEARELFYIVLHGIKFTGMPAWPSLEREDEVWAMVAFLRALPQLDAREYRELVFGPAVDASDPALLPEMIEPLMVPAAVTSSCARCHGVDGLGRGTGAFPKLAGQSEVYLYNSLIAFTRGDRHSGIMEPVAAGLSAEEMREIARYYSALPAGGRAGHATTVAAAAAVRRGEEIALRGIPAQKVPACAGCHGAGGNPPRSAAYPALAGQYPDYLTLQLALFHHEKRGGSPWKELMHPVATNLEPEQMREVATYYGSLDAAEARGRGALPGEGRLPADHAQQ